MNTFNESLVKSTIIQQSNFSIPLKRPCVQIHLTAIKKRIQNTSKKYELLYNIQKHEEGGCIHPAILRCFDTTSHIHNTHKYKPPYTPVHI